MSTVVDNKGLEAPSPFKTFMKNNMQLMLVTVALFVILLFFSIAANGFAKPNIYLDIVLQSAYTGVGPGCDLRHWRPPALTCPSVRA